MTIDLKIQSGPCIFCSETDYPLSMGGPDICPACDCGYDLKTRLLPLQEIIKQLQAENERLKEALEIAYEAYKDKCIGKKYTVKQIGRVHRFCKQALKDK